MFYRSLFWSNYSGKWFQQLADSPLLSELVQQEKRLAEKLHRPILRQDNPIAKRAKLLAEHYSVIEQLFASELLVQILLKGGLLLSRIEINSEQHFELILRHSRITEKEGEFSFCWQQAGSSSPLASVSFTIIPDTNSLSIFIGGLQGPAGEGSREMVAEASKACSGLSPKRAVMEGLFAFAKHIDACAVSAVSDDQQISRAKKTKFFSYDDYWLELGAQRNADNDYSLPLRPIRKQILDAPTKRRAKYRRQHALLDTIYQDTLNVLGTQYRVE